MLRWLLKLFPAAYRETRGEELSDALDAQTVVGWRAAREAIALLGTAGLAWLRFLRTPTGVRHSAFVGALAWLGIVVAYGPVGRVLAFEAGDLYGFYGANDHTFAMIGAGLLVVAIASLVRWRLTAALAGAAGALFSALSLRVGDWQLTSSLTYEARWIGIVLAAALLIKGERRARWLVLPIAPVAFLAPRPAMFVPPLYLIAVAWIRIRLIPEHPWTHLRSLWRREPT